MIRSSIRRAVSNPSAKVPEVLPEWAVEKRTSLSLFFDRFSGKMQRLATKTIALSDKFMGIQPKECLYRVPRLLKVHGKRPTVKDNCFIAPSALVTGDVRVGRKNYIGYNCIIRANEGESILMGESCNIQEKAVVTGNTTIGKWATVEPMAIIDSSDIASCSFVGASAIVMKGCRMESGSMLCAASVLQAGSIIPSGEMWSGNPAQKVADLSEKEREEIVKSAKHMVLLAIEHHDSWELTWEELEDQREGREQFARYAENNRELRMKAMYMKEPPRPNRKAMGRKTPKEVADGGENKPSMMGSHIEGY